MSRPRVVIVGAGFAGYHTARTLSRLCREAVEIVLVNPTDYFLYVPLLPEVAVGLLEPRRIAVSLPDTLPNVRLVLGELTAIDLDARRIHYVNPENDAGQLDYDRLVLAAAASTSRCRSPAPPSTRTGSVRCRRRFSCATTSRSKSNSPTSPTTPRSGKPAARSSWWAAATPARSWRRRGCSTPRSWRAGIPGSAASVHGGFCWTSRTGFSPSSTCACRRSPTGCCGSEGWTSGRA